MKYDPRVERKAELICYHIQTNEGIHLSDKSRHDIFYTTRQVADYWKAECDELREQNHAKRWNELTLWLKRYPSATTDEVATVMHLLNNQEYIRGYVPLSHNRVK